MKGSMPQYFFLKSRKLSVRGEGKVFLRPRKNVQLSTFSQVPVLTYFFKKFITECPKG